MPLPKIEKPEQVVLMEGVQAKKLVKVVKIAKMDPSLEGRTMEIIEKAKSESSKE